jgi:hypothetical protein
MATNDEIKEKYLEFSANLPEAIIGGNIDKALDEARAAGRAEVQSGKLTEVGQSLYDRRKHIEVYTAKKIYEKLKDKMVVRYMNNDDGTVGDEGFYVSLTDVLKVIKLFEKVD